MGKYCQGIRSRVIAEGRSFWYIGLVTVVLVNPRANCSLILQKVSGSRTDTSL